MNNFFYDSSDFALFKRALKETNDEAVVINILSTDSSLKKEEEPKKSFNQNARKNMSSKFEPSPFSKFFGPQKQKTTSIDMKDYSSWKNKNYREAEKSINENKTKTTTKFSINDFLNSRGKKDKFNEIDKTKSDLQKSIDQLSNEDPQYKKFSLNGYMNKLEEKTKAKDRFVENDDILEPLGDLSANIVPTSSQDENFNYSSDTNIESVTFDDSIRGDKFRFESSELDKVKAKLEKLEKEQKNISTKPKTKILTEGSEQKDDFDFSKLGFDDTPQESSVNKTNEVNESMQKYADQSQSVSESLNKTSSVGGESYGQSNPEVTSYGSLQQDQDNNEKYVEVNKNLGQSKKVGGAAGVVTGSFLHDDEQEKDAQQNELDDEKGTQSTESESEEIETDEGESTQINEDESETEEINESESDENTNQSESDEFVSKVSSDKKVDREDILTKDDFRTMTDEFMDKFTELYTKNNPNEQGDFDYDQAQDEPYQDEQFYDPTYDPNYLQLQEKQNELQDKILELIEENKKSSEAERRLREAELEKQRVMEEYEAKIKELQENYQRNYEEMLRQAEIDKKSHQEKLEQVETEYRQRETVIKRNEEENVSKKKSSEILRKELKSNVAISNLEMEKKLLEITNRKHQEKKVKQKEEKEIVQESTFDDNEEENVGSLKSSSSSKQTSSSKKSRKGSSSKTKSKTTRGPRTRKRKIDSDIIGGSAIDFD